MLSFELGSACWTLPSARGLVIGLITTAAQEAEQRHGLTFRDPSLTLRRAASRISGVTPTGIIVLMKHIDKMKERAAHRAKKERQMREKEGRDRERAEAALAGAAAPTTLAESSM